MDSRQKEEFSTRAAPGENQELPDLESVAEIIEQIKQQIEEDRKRLDGGLFEKVDWSEICKVMYSVLKLGDEGKPELVVDLGFGMGVYIAKWMPPGEVWFFDKGRMSDATRIFARLLLHGVRGQFGLLFPPTYTTEDIIELFREYLKMHVDGRIVNLGIDEEDAKWQRR